MRLVWGRMIHCDKLQQKALAQGRADFAMCVKKERKLHAVGEMEVGPPEPLCKRRLQTAISCSGRKTAVVNVMVKRRGLTASGVNERDERK